MPTFSRGDVVKVPFPYTSRPTRQFRPALVVSDGDVAGGGTDFGLIWVLMITSAQNRGWPGDVALDDLSGTGLPAPSVVRTAKIATIEARDALLLGRIGEGARAEVLARVQTLLGLRARA
jgi:mRNA interferase MazF